MSEAETELELDEVFRKAEELVKRAKKVDKILYQLAFVARSMSPLSEEAEKLLDELVELRVITKGQKAKALEDVRIFRDRLLYKRF